ncbi:MAG: hypothetical protein H6566_28605 [Lewinellaceae bacterium]|nr:hypothetical protein [Lewinellaceae bacterium]
MGRPCGICRSNYSTGQATNSNAAERMLLRCRVQEECIKGLEVEKRELERRYRELLRALWNLLMQAFHRAGGTAAG